MLARKSQMISHLSPPYSRTRAFALAGIVQTLIRLGRNFSHKHVLAFHAMPSLATYASSGVRRVRSKTPAACRGGELCTVACVGGVVNALSQIDALFRTSEVDFDFWRRSLFAEIHAHARVGIDRESSHEGPSGRFLIRRMRGRPELKFS